METFTYDHELIQELFDAAVDQPVLTIGLSPGQTAWNPASTKTVIHGPAVLRYEKYPDGGITLTVDDDDIRKNSTS